MRQPDEITIGDKPLSDHLRLHAMWRRGEEGGVRADLSRANLREADLREADLREADLREANLRWAVLRWAVLREADLSGADLGGADLSGADLSWAVLRWAVLRWAVLREADLSGANLPDFQIPDGDLVGWKKAGGRIVRLRIPYRARRTACLINRKCRAEFAVVDWIDGDAEKVRSARGGVYRVGEEVWPDWYCDDFRIDCSHGIHFFLTRAEAERW